MAVKKNTGKSNGKNNDPDAGGRLSAYTTRNRAALIKSAQEVLAEFGLTATIEQLASQSQVSPTTIYNHFGNKEKLLSEALEQAWLEWVVWAYDGDPMGQDLQSMIDVCRKLFRAKETQPQMAKILQKTLDNPSIVINAIKVTAYADLKTVSEKEGFATSNFEEQAYLWAYSLAGIFHRVYVTEDATPEQADKLLELSLHMLDVSKAKAKKIISRPVEGPQKR